MSTDNPFINTTEQVRRPEANEPLIFLEFDGVVHPLPEDGIPASWDSGVLPLLGIRFFLAKPMQQLIRVCETVNAKIVLTTSWRNKGFQISDFNQVFKGLVIGQTPEKSGQLNTRGQREREINAYLEEYASGSPYAIIDSDPHNFSSDDLNLYLTDPKRRFTDEMADRVIQSFR